MKKLFIFLLLCSLPVFSKTGEWTSIGPTDVKVNDYANLFESQYFEVLCTDNGIVLLDGSNYYEFTYGGMPCNESIQLDSNNILIAMGDGTFSDGIYKFDLTTHQFEVQEWALKPHFIIYCPVLNMYYAGCQIGLLYSSNGLNWTFDSTYYNQNCIAMAFCENHLVLSTMEPDSSAYSIYFSNDGGVTWNDASIGSPWISDFYFMEDGSLYGIFPNNSFSSGLWKSTDYGYTWGVEFWSAGMSNVHFNHYLFVGWNENLGGGDGVAIWNANTSALNFINDGLPHHTIQDLAHNKLIFCINVVACTDSGAYMNCEPVVNVNDNITINQFNLSQNYPNPFNPYTTIEFELANDEFVELKVCDILGSEVQTLVRENKKMGHYKYRFNASNLQSGVYFYRLQAGDFIQTKKMVLMK